jgi:hypothetical protein
MLTQSSPASTRTVGLSERLSDFIWCAGRLRVIIAVLVGSAWGLSAGPQPRDILVMLGQSRSSGAWALFVAAIVWLWLNAWFWSGFALASRDPPGEAGPPSRRRRRWRLRLRLWLPRLLSFVPFAGIGIALLGAASAIPGGMNTMMGMDESGASDLQRAAGLILLLGLILLWLLTVLRRVRPTGRNASRQGSRTRALRPAASWWRKIGTAGALLVAASVAAAAAGMLAFGIDPVAAAAIVQPAPTILFAAAAIICIGTILTWVGASSKIPVLGILFALAFALAELRDADLIADNHDIRLLDRPLRPRPDIGMALKQFAAANAAAYPAPEKLPVVLVATSGGGIAAAFWTATILTDLADKVPRFSNQLFAISGVSGGSLGSLVTVGLLGEGKLPAGCPSLRICAQRALGADFLAPTLGSLLYPDLMQRFVPVPIFEDRAVALEKAWETSWRTVTADNRLQSSFLDLWPANHPWPALMLNGTSVRTGGRSITSNVQLTGGDMALSMEAEDLLSMAGADVRASTAADNSARFPLFGPVGVLRQHAKANLPLPPAADLVVDGGYFEDFGATTLLEMLDVLHESAQRENIPVRFVVIQIIGAPPVEISNMQSSAMPRGLFGPLVTLLRTRDARGAAATEALARRVATLGGVYVPLRLGISPTGQSAPLSWSLSAIAQHVIDVQWTAACRDALAGKMNLSLHVEAVPGMSYGQMMSVPPCQAASP